MYIVEGNIGVGKSTFLTLMKKNLSEVKILTEPKDNWTNQIYGQSLLENFYKNPQRWAYTLETFAMMCRAKDHINEQADKSNNILVERSIYSGHYCFAQNGYESGFFSKIEWQVYNKWVEFLLHQKCDLPRGFIYLKADPEICYKRIQKRNRISEKKITLRYIKQIDTWHEKFLIQKEGIFEDLKKVPVLILDCSHDFIDIQANLHKHIVKLQNFFEKTNNCLFQGIGKKDFYKVSF
ncbi:deoxynucleoside kinase [Candidatus Dependentiae bacterium]